MKNKSFILLFAVFFGIVSPLLLTESFIENCNNLRRNYIVAKNQSSETITIATNQWTTICNKKEIYFKNNYYDIKNVFHNKGVTTLVLIKDKFENVIKISFNKKASKKDKNKKQSTFFANYCILQSTKKAVNNSKKDIISTQIVQLQQSLLLFLLIKPPIA